ncbi:EamA family transporter [Gordonia sinesedis]
MLFSPSARACAATSFRHHLGLGMLAAAGVLWGLGGVSGRMLSSAGAFSALDVAALRMLVGGLALVAIARLTRSPWPRTGRARTRVVVTGVLCAVFQGCYFASVAAGSVAVATLVTIGLSPVIVVTVECLRARRLRAGAAVTLTLAVPGLTLLVRFPAGDGAPIGGVLFATVAAAAFACTVLLNARPLPGLGPVVLAGGGFLVAAAVLAVPAVLTHSRPVSWSSDAVGWLLVLGIGATAIPYALYFAGLTRESASTASVFALLEPLTATVLSAVAFGEALGIGGWIGAALLCASVTAASAGRGRSRTGRWPRPQPD